MNFAGLPKQIAIGVAWVSVAAVFASWVGWLEAPTLVAERARAQQEQAEKRAQDAERAIWVLQWEQGATTRELAKINGRLDEMSKSINSMGQR